MTSPTASAFIEDTSTDGVLQAEWNAAETPNELVEVGKRHGYNFDVAELEATLDSLRRLQGGELDEADLGSVAGGISLSTSFSSSLSKAGLQFYEGWPCKWLGDTGTFGK